MSNSEPIADPLERFKAATYAKDLGAFVALYDDDTRVFDSWGQWAYQGTGEWRRLRKVDNRLTWVLRETPQGEWKILHEHTSAPVVAGKVALRR